MKKVMVLTMLILAVCSCNKLQESDRKKIVEAKVESKTFSKSSDEQVESDKEKVAKVESKTSFQSNGEKAESDKEKITKVESETFSKSSDEQVESQKEKFAKVTSKEVQEAPKTLTVSEELGQLNVEISCPGIAFMGKRIRATVIVENTGAINLNGVIINADTGPDLNIISVEGNTAISGSSVIWNIDSLAVAERKEYSVVAIAAWCGRQCFSIIVNTNEGLRKTAECCTQWNCCPGLLLECYETVDPLISEEETTYTIEVTNQGTRPDYNVKIEVVFPAEMMPVSADGDTECVIAGQHVSTFTYPILQPKEKIKWEITAKAVQLGDARVKAYLSSKFLQTPVVEEESTHVY